MSRFVRHGGVLAGLVSLATLALADTAAEQYGRWSSAEHPAQRCIRLDVDLLGSPGFSATVTAAGGELRYRMAFNNVAEGWSWQPQAHPDDADYYRYKFLPLQSESELRGNYTGEDKIGTLQEMRVEWRYDYFLAFDNAYDFYARRPDDDAGFVLDVAGALPEQPVMRVTACLEEPATQESTTFWKAVHGNPRDFTLKKRYLMGHLESVEFLDGRSGRRIGELLPHIGQAF